MVEKNKKKLLDKSQRVWYNMNTGTRVHKDAKHPSRNKIKKDFKKMLDKLETLWYNKYRKWQSKVIKTPLCADLCHTSVAKPREMADFRAVRCSLLFNRT